MNELTQIQRARIVADSFVPTEPSGGCYAYVFLGQASWDASTYEELDGQYLLSRRMWHVDETKTDCVCYTGRGQNGRINDQRYHSVLPAPHLRIKLKSDLSYSNSVLLERLIIEELGCICDADRSDGCLINLKYHENGPLVCPSLEAAAYKILRSQQKAVRKAAAVRTVDVIAMTADKTIISRGSCSGLARELKCSTPDISKCCKRSKRGIWQKPRNRALYFCYAEEYETYEIIPMTNQQLSKNRILIAAKLDGSDICCGTAGEIRTYAPEIKSQQHLHGVAQGKQKSAYGWTARYSDEVADELEAPVATCGPNLSGFY